jgi:hypothetical protein
MGLVDGLSGDTLLGGTENDTLYSVDQANDKAGGGAGFDIATMNSFDGQFSNDIEHRSNASVGHLRLAPAVVKAHGGAVARLSMSWKHPKAWRMLRKVELRLYRGTKPVSKIGVSPSTERITNQGAVKAIAGGSRVTHEGKAVIATLALRVPRSLAGQQLRVDVVATDKRGRKQLEPSAGMIRVTK